MEIREPTNPSPEPIAETDGASLIVQRQRLYENIARGNRFTEVEQVAEKAILSERRNTDQRVLSR